jgi:hypothetical protein
MGLPLKNGPARTHAQVSDIDSGQSTFQFIDWCNKHYVRRPDIYFRSYSYIPTYRRTENPKLEYSLFDMTSVFIE